MAVTPSALFAYHTKMSGQCDRPHVLLEDLTTRSGGMSPAEEIEYDMSGCGARETRRSLMSDSKDYTIDPPPPQSYSTLLPSSSSLLLEDMAIDHSLPNSILFTNDDRITSLERSVCSNFICCGENLPDFHALIDHFEENHVSIVSPSGKKLYPKQQPPKPKIEIDTTNSLSRSSPMSPASSTLDSTASTPASSRSSSVVPSPPMPVTPLSPPSHGSPFPDAGVTIASHDRSPAPPIAPHLPPAQSSLILPAIEYNPYIGIIAPLIADEHVVDAVAPKPKAATPSPPPQKHQQPPFSVEVISAFGPEYDFARDYARYEEAWKRKTTREAEEASLAAAAYEQAQLERELREAEEEEMERMGFSLGLHHDSTAELDALGLEGMQLIDEQATTRKPKSSGVSYSPSAAYPSSSTSRSSSQPPATNHGGRVPKTARPRPRVNTFLPLAPSSSSSSSSSTPSSSPPSSSASSSTPGLPQRPKVTIPTIPNAPPVSLGKKREKAYKCPHWGCMKAYLNPNGLKYHLEKGTCKFDESAALRGGFVRSTTSATASAAMAASASANTVGGAQATLAPSQPTPMEASTMPMEVEEDSEEEESSRSMSNVQMTSPVLLTTRPPLQAVSNGSCYAGASSMMADGKSWMTPCAI